MQVESNAPRAILKENLILESEIRFQAGVSY